ncbi:hypothetical protein CVD25_15360 [Bacillus canaveralius]|uniref:LITAF domain-containing protein n=1 Tax=Bacillus canaveralius TaxID=1403243 RepID=A0A2N5GK78_9BACI|nr:hypothetical protein [Bacillus canaveralius]PLR81845.1 hypothetical protein CU635_13885 [Bacillus canaveralius]PLR94999.1 hypothetical protein CVD25_15360 [Bacillus canaveralius]
MTEVIRCPKCASDQLYAGEKGFSVGKAVIGVITIGSLGALAGLHGKNKVVLNCFRCKHTWSPTGGFDKSKPSAGLAMPAQYKSNGNSKTSRRSGGPPGGYTKKYLNGLAKVFWGVSLFNLLLITVFVCTYILF